VKILRRHEVVDRTRLSRDTIRRREHAGTFPRRVKLGPNSVGWIEEEVDAWIASRPRGTVCLESPAALQPGGKQP
jgi:prophage regulatory protein